MQFIIGYKIVLQSSHKDCDTLRQIYPLIIQEYSPSLFYNRNIMFPLLYLGFLCPYLLLHTSDLPANTRR